MLQETLIFFAGVSGLGALLDFLIGKQRQDRFRLWMTIPWVILSGWKPAASFLGYLVHWFRQPLPIGAIVMFAFFSQFALSKYFVLRRFENAYTHTFPPVKQPSPTRDLYDDISLLIKTQDIWPAEGAQVPCTRTDVYSVFVPLGESYVEIDKVSSIQEELIKRDEVFPSREELIMRIDRSFNLIVDHYNENRSQHMRMFTVFAGSSYILFIATLFGVSIQVERRRSVTICLALLAHLGLIVGFCFVWPRALTQDGLVLLGGVLYSTMVMLIAGFVLLGIMLSVLCDVLRRIAALCCERFQACEKSPIGTFLALVGGCGILVKEVLIPLLR